jgi:hypothetical protein
MVLLAPKFFGTISSYKSFGKSAAHLVLAGSNAMVIASVWVAILGDGLEGQ